MASSSVTSLPWIDHDQNHDPWRDLRPIHAHLINTSSSTSPPPQAQPPPSESSPKSRTLETEVLCTSSSGSGKVGDLIQMWRELEAEATISPTNKANQQHLVFEERSGSWETCDDVTGWESDLTVESEKEHGSGKKTDQGLLRWKSVEMDKSFAGVGILDGNHLLKVRGRQITQKLFAKFEGERKNESQWIKEKRAVSGFAYRKKINNFLRYKSMQNKKAVQNLRPQSTAQELDQLNCRIPILLLRQQFSPRPMPLQSCPSPLKEKICLDSKCGEIRQQHLSSGQLLTCKSVPVSENKNMFATPFSIDSFNSEQQETCESRSSAVEKKSGGVEVSQSNSDLSAENHQADIQRNLDNIVQAGEDYLASESEDLQEGSRHLDLSWEEGSPRMGTVDWEGFSGQDEPYMDHNQQIEEADGMWLTDVCPSHIVLEGYREAMYTNLLETYSDHSELRQLLERRTVTTSLSSDFPVKLNKLMLSCLQSRRMAESEENTTEGYEENTIEEDEDQLVHADDEEPVQTHAPGLVDDDALIEKDVVHLVLDMRTQIANVHNEINQLRKLVACCMQKNTRQYSIQEDTYIRRSAPSGNILSSQWEPVKKGNCHICYGKQVDSLIYRCGHMCTCFECATELQWSSGRCPVCKTPIVDVVRAYIPS